MNHLHDVIGSHLGFGWWLFGLSFVMGFVLTFALSVRPAKRQVPVGAPTDLSASEVGIKSQPPAMQIPAADEFFTTRIPTEDEAPTAAAIPIAQRPPRTEIPAVDEFFTSSIPADDEAPTAAAIPVAQRPPRTEIPAVEEFFTTRIPAEDESPAPVPPVEQEPPATEVPVTEAASAAEDAV